MTVSITIQGENGLDAATQLRNLLLGLQLANPIPTEAQAKEGKVADKAADKPKPAPKDKPKADEDEDEQEQAPAPKAKSKPKAAKKPAEQEDDDSEEEETPKAKKEKAPLGELKDDGKPQEPTVDGCRIMIRRVARAQGEEYALALLAEFEVEGASKVPEKRRKAFIKRAEEIIEDPETIDIEEAAE